MKRRQGRPRAGGVVTYVRLPREVRSEVQRRAAADQRSVSAWIRLAIEKVLHGGR
jgi:predicted HicB family RNase H-like nuclease